MTKRHARQPDLLDWQPPEPVERFDEGSVRAATISGRVCRALALALKDSGASREQLAERMTAYLGEPVSKNMLDAYASPAREEHVINLVRFIGLLHATRDRRLLEMVAEMFGWAVVERRFLPLIDLAQVQERQDELRRHADALRRTARQGGVL